MQDILLFFFLAFLTNFIWENLHARFYAHYRGGPITKLVLFRASLYDAFVITLMAVVFMAIPALYERLWLVLIFGIVFAVILERWALKTKRWEYKKSMPIIPVLKVGLTPAIQLGLIAYLIYLFVIG